MRTFHRWKLSLAIIGTALVAFAATSSAQVKISEIRTDQSGTDTDEYFELSGSPGTSLSGLTYIVIGDSGSVASCGVIEAVVHLDSYSIQADGLFAAADADPGPTLTGYDALIPGPNGLNFENSDNVTHLLVSGFTGQNGQDLDTNDNGVLDVTPWTAVLDCVGLTTGVAPNCSGSEYLYCGTVLGPDGSFVPGHVYRCSDTGQWKIGAFSPLGATDTPGRANLSCRGPTPEIIDESRDPCVPLVGQAATATAVLRHATGANVYYTVNGGAMTTVPMTFAGLSGSDSIFRALIPGRPTNGDRVEYRVKAFNGNPDTVSGFNQGYFAGTTNVAALRVNDAFGQSRYRFYGARVHGSVTVADGVFSTIDTDYYVQDLTGGINVFKFGRHQVRPGLGDDVTISGIIDQYRGKLELTDGGPCDTLLVAINDVGVAPDPAVVNSCQLGEAYEGLLVRMNGAKLATTDTQFPANLNSDYRIVNCATDSVTLRIDRDTDIDGNPITTKIIDVIGIAAQFDSIPPYSGDYQIQPRAYADITFRTTNVGDSPGAIGPGLMPSRPNPFSRSAEIHYWIPAGPAGERVRVRLELLDIQGRVVATLVDELQNPGDHVAKLDAGMLRARGSGIHFYRLELDGKVFTKKAVLLR